jgi:hypothetical protein
LGVLQYKIMWPLETGARNRRHTDNCGRRQAARGRTAASSNVKKE